MVSAAKTKSADKQAVIKKLLPAIKKHGKVAPSATSRTVLETILFAICLENVSVPEAEAAFQNLMTRVPDLNEIRVSSVNEIEPLLLGIRDADWKAFRIRSTLQYIFEKNYAYEFEGLKKKTQELAEKQLAKIKQLTPFVRTYTLHLVLGAHLLPLDHATVQALAWMGLVTLGQSEAEVAESLKSVVRKSEAEDFCDTIRSVAVDPGCRAAFEYVTASTPVEDTDAATAIDRLQDLFKNGWVAPKVKTKAEPKVPAKASKDKAKEPAAETPVAPKKSAKDVVAKEPSLKETSAKDAKPAKESATKDASAKPASTKAAAAKESVSKEVVAKDKKPAAAKKADAKADSKVESKAETKASAKTAVAPPSAKTAAPKATAKKPAAAAPKTADKSTEKAATDKATSKKVAKKPIAPAKKSKPASK